MTDPAIHDAITHLRAGLLAMRDAGQEPPIEIYKAMHALSYAEIATPEVKADPLREALMNCLGCVEAAEAEGLHEIVGDLRGRDEQTDRLIDLVERRLMWVRNYADSALAAPQPPAPITTEQIDRETLRQRAREAGDAAYKSWTGKPFSLDGMQIIADAILALSPPVTTDRAAVIEECAKVCDRWIRSKNLHESLAATDIASAIRALVDAKEEGK